jgi:hypothetical protein
MGQYYAGELLTLAEVARILRPSDNPDEIRSQISKELSRNRVRYVEGWPRREVELLAEYRSLSLSEKLRWPFQKWLEQVLPDEIVSEQTEENDG